jgi:hypothetical protein
MGRKQPYSYTFLYRSNLQSSKQAVFFKRVVA